MADGASSPFGDLLKRYRAAAGLTQDELAERAGVSARTISDLERGVKHRPHDYTVQRLVRALDLSPEKQAGLEAAGRPAAGASGQHLAHDRSAGVARRAEPLYPLAGRDSELALLEPFLAGADEGEGAAPLLLLTGEPGVGKTRLLEVTVERAVNRGWRVLAAGCHRHAENEPYAPLLEALLRYTQTQTEAGLQSALAGCAWLVHLLPELAGTLTPLPAGAHAPEQERRLMFAAVARFLANVAGSAGTLLVLDDLQWAGPDALDLLVSLVRTGPASLRIVGAYRETELSPHSPLWSVLTDLAPTGLVRRHTIGPLDPAEAEALFLHLLAGVQLESGTAVQQALDRAGGIPFFLVSYAQALKLGSTEAVPWDLAQGVRQRVALLSQAGKEMLAAAAVVGQRAPWGLLTAVAGQTDEAGLAGLEEASQGRLLVESAQGDYVFAHHVIREVVESDLGAARRAFLHGRAAEALESQPAGAAPGLLAYHYVRSGHEEKAAAYLERAGDAARERYANAAAAEHYRSALTHLASDADLTRVTLKLGVVLTAAGRYDEAVEVLERAAAHDRSAGDWNGEARDIALLGEVHFRRGTIREGLARVQAMLDSLPPSVQSGAAPLYVALARLGPRHDLLVSAQRAAEFARLGQDDGVLATAEALVGQGLLLSHRPQDALELYERLIPTYEAAGDLPSLCLSLTRCAHAHAALGAFDEARVDLERALAAAERIDDQPLVAEVLELIGWHAVIMGEWQAADEYIGRLEDVAHSLGTDRLPVTLLLLRGSLALFRGEWDQATQNFEEAERVTLRTNDPMWRAVQDKLAARDLATGHPEAALIRQAQPAMHLDTDEAWGRLVEHAEAHLAVGNLDRAEEIVAEALARFGSRDDRLRQSELLLVHGMLLARRERWEAAAAVFDEGISLSRGLPYPYLEARMLYQFGTMLVRQDDLEGAAWRLDDALKIFRRLGASKDVARVEQALEILKQAPSSNQAGAPREQAEREQAHSCNQRK